MANSFKEAAERKKALADAQKAPEKEPAVAPAPHAANDLLANLVSDKSASKSYAFYLTESNVEKLKKLAAEKNVSASKLLDHILSEILI